MEGTQSHTEGKLWFLFALLYLFFDYGRPHDIIPAIGAARPLLLITVMLMAFVLIRGRFDYFWSPHINVIWLFIILIALHVPFAHNNRYAFRTFKSMLLYMPFLLSIVFTVTTIKRIRLMMFAGVLLMIALAVFSILNEGRGPGNYFLDENDISLFVNTWLPFCYFLLIAEKSAWKKSIYAVGLIIGLASVVISFSRGGFVGLIAVAAVVWLFSRRKILAFAGIALLSTVVFYVGDEAYWNEMETVTDTQESTAQKRLLFWEAGWDMFLDNPLGVGGNNYQVRIPEYQSPEFRRDMYGVVAHSLWFTLMPELGIVGVILFVILLVFNLRSLFFMLKLTEGVDRCDGIYLQALARAFIAGFAGFFASGTFVSVLYYAHYWYLTAFIIAAEEITFALFGEQQPGYQLPPLEGAE
ncbi:MAG: O-antigen ligase family protein [Chitinivibrionales bacterium]